MDDTNSPTIFTVTPFTIIRDNNEQAPWGFHGFVDDVSATNKPLLVRVEIASLNTGDYSLKGFEELVCVERKSLNDLYGTISDNFRGRAKAEAKAAEAGDIAAVIQGRFDRELERMAQMEFACVVVEASLSLVLTCPPPAAKLKPKTVFRQMLAWQQRYPNVGWLFGDGVNGRRLAETICFRHLERFWNRKQRQLNEQEIANLAIQQKGIEPCVQQSL